MKRIELDHVERLSRGKRSGINAGSRSVAHHLRPYERATYERALKKGYLDITEKDRVNLWHIWEKACRAMECEFLVLIKDIDQGVGTIYRENIFCSASKLAESKHSIQAIASGIENNTK